MIKGSNSAKLSAFERNMNEKTLQSLQAQKEALESDPQKIKEQGEQKVGGYCVQPSYTTENLKMKCSFDRHYLNAAMNSLDDCVSSASVASDATINARENLMIGNDSVFDEAQSFQMGFYPCNQAFEDEIQSGITCVPNPVESLINSKQSVGLWWFESHVYSDADVVLNASPAKSMRDQDPYKLVTRRGE